MNERDVQQYEPTREDVLIGRVSDGEATPNDWADLERLAAEDDGVWSRLATAQRAHARLSEAVDDEIAVCELVGLPKAPSKVRSLVARGIGIAGWGVAAALALAVINGPRGVEPVEPGGLVAGGAGASTTYNVVPAGWTSDQMMDEYMQQGKREGRVLGELPSRLVESRGLGDGLGREAVYVRMILEMKHVGEMDIVGNQRTGNGEPVRVKMRVPDKITGQPI